MKDRAPTLRDRVRSAAGPELRSDSFYLAGAVIVSSVVALATFVALPFLLSPSEYAGFSLIIAFAQLSTSLVFEWIRVSLLRHFSEGDAPSAFRNELAWIYAALVALLLIVSAVAALVSLSRPGAAIVALIALCAAAQGLFEGRSAAARAGFENVKLANAMIARAVLSVALAVALAWLTGSAFWAAIGIGVSFLLAALLLVSPGASRPRLARIDRDRFLQLLKFGWPIGLGSNLSLAIAAMTRLIIAGALGLAGAGPALLALDIAQRVFTSLAMTMNMLFVQPLIRLVDSEPKAAALLKVRSCLTLEATMILLALALVLTGAAILGQLIAPEAYRSDFIRWFPAFALFSACLVLRQYVIDAVFVIFRKPGPVAIAPAATLVCILGLLGAVHVGAMPGELLPAAFAILAVAGVGAGLLFAHAAVDRLDLWRPLAVATAVTLVSYLPVLSIDAQGRAADLTKAALVVAIWVVLAAAAARFGRGWEFPFLSGQGRSRDGKLP